MTRTAGDIRRDVLAKTPSASRDFLITMLAWLGPDDRIVTDEALEAMSARILADSMDSRARRKHLARRKVHLLGVVRAIMERERDRRAAVDPNAFYTDGQGRRVARYPHLPRSVQHVIRSRHRADRNARAARGEDVGPDPFAA